jgi:hypothetical protein
LFILQHSETGFYDLFTGPVFGAQRNKRKELIHSKVQELNDNEEARNATPIQLTFPKWTDDSSDSEDEK